MSITILKTYITILFLTTLSIAHIESEHPRATFISLDKFIIVRIRYIIYIDSKKEGYANKIS